MLNGIAPIMIFSFKKLLPSVEAALSSAIPLIADTENSVFLPLVPLYLDEKLFGIYIESESKNIDIETEPKTLPDGTVDPEQKGLLSSVTINMVAKRDSIGMIVLMAMSDIIFPMVTSQEYNITYLNGSMTIFTGLLHSFSIDQNTDNDLYKISMQISSGKKGKTKLASAPIVVPNEVSEGIDSFPSVGGLV
jgi:hypothetical protein